MQSFNLCQICVRGMERTEEEEEACMGSGSWEEQIYWSHFQYTYFFRLLLPGFDKSLAIPDHFSRNVRKKLPETVGLKGPSGITWKVGLVARGCTTFFEQGWKEFVKDHSLRKNDLLVFKFDGDSSFEVTMFDRRSSCEIAATYFVRERGINGELRNDIPLERNTLNISPELFHDDDTSKKFASDGIDKPPKASLTRPVVSLKASSKATKLKQKNNAFDVVDVADSGNALPDNKETYIELDSTHPSPDSTHPSPDSTHLTMHGGSGKIVTQRAKNRALRSAEAAISKKGFTIVMIPSRLSRKGIYLAPIRPRITKKLAFSEKQDVILRMNGDSWTVKLIRGVIKKTKLDKRGSFSGFCGGWKNFVKDNNIQEYDVCAFEPVVAEENTIVLSVKIFRVEDHES